MSQRNRLSEPKKKQEFFENLPYEIIVDILSRLPVRTVVCCKCVCKPWLNLLETDGFVKSHLSKSVPGLVLKGKESCKIFEFEDGLDLEHIQHHCIPVTEYDSIYYGQIEGSVNGLLFYCNMFYCSEPDRLHILNPITRECIQIPSPQEFAGGKFQLSTYGFGVGRVTGQYKLVRIFRYHIDDNKGMPAMVTPSCECQIYTLGTGFWRSITPEPLLEYKFGAFGVFLNGNLHWLVFDLKHSPLILCFDLEDELFSVFPSPPTPHLVQANRFLDLYALEDGLCFSDWTSEDETVIWFMKDYGVEKSWVKELVISTSQFHNPSLYDTPRPIKVFKNGDILVEFGGPSNFYYSKKTKTIHEINICEGKSIVDSILHTSSFLSLKSFVKEDDVISF